MIRRRGEFLHDAAGNEPIHRHNRTDGNEHQQADAQHERRDQGKGAAVSIQMLFGRDVTILPKAVALRGERGSSQGDNARHDSVTSAEKLTSAETDGRPGRGWIVITELAASARAGCSGSAATRQETERCVQSSPVDCRPQLRHNFLI